MSYPCYTDESALVERVCIGDFNSLEVLYLRYNRVVYSLAFKILQDQEASQDAVQDAFLRFWKKPTSYNPTGGHFISWLLTVVRNISLDYLRRATYMPVSLDLNQDEQNFEPLPDERASVEDIVWLNLQHNIIRQALNDLPFQQRMIIEIAFFKDLTHQEIAAQTGLPLGTVKSRIRQGLLKLKAMSAVSALASPFRAVA